jgi:hypothetical protein
MRPWSTARPVGSMTKVYGCSPAPKASAPVYVPASDPTLSIGVPAAAPARVPTRVTRGRRVGSQAPRSASSLVVQVNRSLRQGEGRPARAPREQRSPAGTPPAPQQGLGTARGGWPKPGPPLRLFRAQPRRRCGPNPHADSLYQSCGRFTPNAIRARSHRLARRGPRYSARRRARSSRSCRGRGAPSRSNVRQHRVTRDW